MGLRWALFVNFVKHFCFKIFIISWAAKRSNYFLINFCQILNLKKVTFYTNFTSNTIPIKNKMNLLFHASLPDDGIFFQKNMYNLKEEKQKVFFYIWQQNEWRIIFLLFVNVRVMLKHGARARESKINLRIQNWVLIWWVYGVLPMLAVASFHFAMEILVQHETLSDHGKVESLLSK